MCSNGQIIQVGAVILTAASVAALAHFNSIDAHRFSGELKLARGGFLSPNSSGVANSNFTSLNSITNVTSTDRLRVAFFMTTALSTPHQLFFHCWEHGSRQLKLLQSADVLIYAPQNLSEGNLAQFRHMGQVTVRNFKNTGYKGGAVMATLDGFGPRAVEEKWFDNYDWVIRLNPDVLIMDDEWLLQTMKNSSIDGIFQNCGDCRLQTDFFAVRVKAVDSHLVNRSQRSNAETHTTQSFSNILRSGRFEWVKGGTPMSYTQCRIMGSRSPVVHVHDLMQYCKNGSYLQHRNETDYTGAKNRKKPKSKCWMGGDGF